MKPLFYRSGYEIIITQLNVVSTNFSLINSLLHFLRCTSLGTKNNNFDLKYETFSKHKNQFSNIDLLFGEKLPKELTNVLVLFLQFVNVWTFLETRYS